FYNRVEDRLDAAWIKADDLIVPYLARSLDKSPRYTHRMYLMANELRKKQVADNWLDIALPEPDEKAHSETEIIEEKVEGRSDERGEKDLEYTVYEIYIDLDIPGMEDLGEDGEPTGIALPYIVTVEKDSQKVLCIRRNWKEDDEMKKRR